MPAIERFDPVVEAGNIAFDRRGNGEPVLLISGFPQTRRSWNKIVALLAPNFETIAADLPAFGESGFLSVAATTALLQSRCKLVVLRRMSIGDIKWDENIGILGARAGSERHLR
jgi:pimeloyl-ACP methyl ester carboxylesterase